MVIEVRSALGFKEPHVASACERSMDSRMRRSHLAAESTQTVVRAAMATNISNTAWAARQRVGASAATHDSWLVSADSSPLPTPTAMLSSQRALAGSPSTNAPPDPTRAIITRRLKPSSAQSHSRSLARRLAGFVSATKRPVGPQADLSGMTPEQLKAEEVQILAQLEELGWVECQVTGQFIRRKVDQPQLARRKLAV